MAQMFAGFVCFFAWVSGSIPYPASKRAVALGLINSVAQFGNIIGMSVHFVIHKMMLT
jgi:hypothetical protein